MPVKVKQVIGPILALVVLYHLLSLQTVISPLRPDDAVPVASPPVIEIDTQKDEKESIATASPSLKLDEQEAEKEVAVVASPSIETTAQEKDTTVTTEPPSSSTTPRLEFLHIQKNAGSLIETLGISQNISWGACHFDFPWKKGEKYLKNCPPLNYQNQSSRTFYWHFPLQYLPLDQFRVNPYDNLLDQDYVARPKRYFAIVRDPYDRMVSFYYHNNKRKEPTQANMNEWIQRTLSDPGTVGLFYPNATICQYQYIYSLEGNTTKQLVDHVIQFEYLAEDFNNLAKEYNLNLSIPSTKINAGKKRSKSLQISLLYNDTISMLNMLCPEDFTLGRGYSMIQV